MKELDIIIRMQLSIPGRDVQFRLKKAIFDHLTERAKQSCKTECGANLIILFLQDEFNLTITKDET